jgi:hypothetical protein
MFGVQYQLFFGARLLRAHNQRSNTAKLLKLSASDDKVGKGLHARVTFSVFTYLHFILSLFQFFSERKN